MVTHGPGRNCKMVETNTYLGVLNNIQYCILQRLPSQIISFFFLQFLYLPIHCSSFIFQVNKWFKNARYLALKSRKVTSYPCTPLINTNDQFFYFCFFLILNGQTSIEHLQFATLPLYFHLSLSSFFFLEKYSHEPPYSSRQVVHICSVQRRLVNLS